jgi:cellulose synthase/poly-beta-1,6-N-acetylglucosamine synthase-like glycosyltransferase
MNSDHVQPLDDATEFIERRTGPQLFLPRREPLPDPVVSPPADSTMVIPRDTGAQQMLTYPTTSAETGRAARSRNAGRPVRTRHHTDTRRPSGRADGLRHPRPRGFDASETTVYLRPRPDGARRIAEGRGVRGRLWRDFDADPEWIGAEPVTGELPLERRGLPAVPVPEPLPGAKRSILPRGLSDPTRWTSDLHVQYLGRHRIATFVPLLGKGDFAVRAFFVMAWVASFVVFWFWWFHADHLVTVIGFALNTALLARLCYLPVYFVLASLRLRRVNPRLPVRDFRVAFVVTKAPSEPWDVLLRTLGGMRAQDYPHPYDVWICDEDPADETYAWCERHGVGISTRKGFADYHQATWPRRTKCKEGNLSFFYDHWGYDYYDVVAQLDADHVPGPDYLAHMVRPFADPKIGYVAAPSVCDANASNSWAARARLFQEANLHGAVQVGSNGWLAPVCFGSHYAVRTTALRDIGGIGPELAEDFSTTYLMCAAGWDGAFAIDAEAHGDGPDTFAAALTQEFQWSRSIMVVFMDTFPRHVRNLPWLLRARFLFQLCYYPLMAVATAVGVLLAPAASIFGIQWVKVNYIEFLALWSVPSAIMMIMNAHLRGKGLFRPQRAKLGGWESWLFTMARWPYVCWGCFSAVLQQIRPKPVTFKVTPKGDRGVEKLPTGLLWPYIGVSLVAFYAALYGSRVHNPPGYLLLCLGCGFTYLMVIVGVSLMHVIETGRSTGARGVPLVGTISQPLFVILLLVLIGTLAGFSAWQAYLSSNVNLWHLMQGVG